VSAREQRPLAVLLVGAGRIGHVHAANLAARADTELAVVVDVVEDAARALASRYGARHGTDAPEVLASGTVGACVVCSPTPTHTEIVDAALRHGVPVLCEKPLDLDPHRAAELLRKHPADGRAPAMMGFNRRFDPHFAAARARVVAGEIGPVEQLAITSRDPAPPPTGYLAGSGGIFRDMMIHDLDMARFFVPEIVRVTASGSAVFSNEIAEQGDADTAVAVLEGTRGEQIVVTNSRHCSYGYDQRLEVSGPLGTLAVGNPTPTTVRLSGAAGTGQADPCEPFFLERYRVAYAAELAAFVAAVRGEKPCSPDLEDGLAATVLAEAATQSAATGRRVDIARFGTGSAGAERTGDRT
jgi:myo-inositol 2-dehydrogenase/D-chiro-inositol 1-dehydrogenase